MGDLAGEMSRGLTALGRYGPTPRLIDVRRRRLSSGAQMVSARNVQDALRYYPEVNRGTRMKWGVTLVI